MTIYLNDKAIETLKDTNLLTFLKENGLADKGGIAIAINNTVISKPDWKTKTLNNNDQLTLITATAGG